MFQTRSNNTNNRPVSPRIQAQAQQHKQVQQQQKETEKENKGMSEREVSAAARRCPGGLYEDPEFPASPSSLFINPSRPSHPPSQVAAWLRPSEIAPQPALFIGGSSSGDICQGALGDCWFLGALAVVADRWDLLESLVVSEHPELGFYQFRFWKDGDWVVVTIDDRLPCTASRKPIYGHCTDQNEMWVPLMEKAYAKLHKSYEALSGGSIVYAFVDLTSGAAEKVYFEELIAQNKLWDRMKWYKEEGWLMGTSISREGTAEGSAGQGLLIKHAYSIIDLREVSGEKIIRLRNPWGNTDWTGAWGDQDKRWTPELLKRLNFSLGDDGDFWMSLKDYQSYFNRIFICRLYHDEIGKVWKKHSHRGVWQDRGAGGCMNHVTWVYNPQLGLTPGNKPTTAFISLYQNDTRMTGVPSTAIGLYVLETPNNKLLKTTPVGIVGSTKTFEDTREVSVELNLEAGKQYIIIPCTFDPGFSSPYHITVYTEYDSDIHVVELDGDEDKDDPLNTKMKGLSLRPGSTNYSNLKDLSKRNTKPVKPYRENVNPISPRPPGGNSNPTPTPTPSAQPTVPRIVSPRGAIVSPRVVSPRREISPRAPQSGASTARAALQNADPSSLNLVKLTNGDSYHGQLRGNVKHGVGMYKYANGDVYIGEFRDGNQDGDAEYIFNNGDRYNGRVWQGKFNGRGTFYFKSGDIYDGDFRDGVRHGSGTFRYHDGSVYQGDYRDGVKAGNGIMIQTDKSRYEGEYRDGKPNGRGTYIFSDGSVYRGNFVDDNFHDDKAAYQGANGEVYTGSFRNGERQGQGFLKSPKGFQYTGDFSRGKMHGRGEYVYAAGDVYKGEFRDDNFNGQGTYTFAATGTSLNGLFRDGRPVK